MPALGRRKRWAEVTVLKPSAGVSSAALLTVTVLNYVLAFSAIVLFYLFYTQPDDCAEHKVFISLNFIFCILVSVIAVLPKVQVSATSLPVLCSCGDAGGASQL